MNVKNYFRFIYLFFLLIISHTNHVFSSEFCNTSILKDISANIEKTNYQPVAVYNELRNDTGIFFKKYWDSKENKIKIKRNKKNYPIVSFSLFNKKEFKPNKTIIKLFNRKDLSSLTDGEIEKLIKQNGISEVITNDEEKIIVEAKSYYFNEFELVSFDLKSINEIDANKGILEISFEAKVSNTRNDLKTLISPNYQNFDGLEAICQDLKLKINWPIEKVAFDEFKYDADVREGLKNKEILATSVFDLINDKGNIKSLRTEKGVASFRQYFDFKKFPFDTQDLVIRLKTNVGNWSDINNKDNSDSGSVSIISPGKNVYLNLERFLDPRINKLKAWNIPENGIELNLETLVNEKFYDSDYDKIIQKSENILEIKIKIDRNYQHYLFKIMLPVFLILCVAWYVLWIPTEKYEARLNTSIIALLALIAYNFVFQDDIPKLEYLTNLDWFILLSYIFCCIPVFLSIAFSKFISKNQGKVMKVNNLIKYWGALIYLIISLTIFQFN